MDLRWSLKVLQQLRVNDRGEHWCEEERLPADVMAHWRWSQDKGGWHYERDGPVSQLIKRHISSCWSLLFPKIICILLPLRIKLTHRYCYMHLTCSYAVICDYMPPWVCVGLFCFLKFRKRTASLPPKRLVFNRLDKKLGGNVPSHSREIGHKCWN